MSIDNLTRTRAKEITRNRVPGYFKPNPVTHADDWVPCPLCRAQLTLGRGYPASLKEPTMRELDNAVIRHLLDAYDDSRCPEVASVRPRPEVR